MKNKLVLPKFDIGQVVVITRNFTIPSMTSRNNYNATQVFDMDWGMKYESVQVLEGTLIRIIGIKLVDYLVETVKPIEGESRTFHLPQSLVAEASPTEKVLYAK